MAACPVRLCVCLVIQFGNLSYTHRIIQEHLWPSFKLNTLKIRSINTPQRRLADKTVLVLDMATAKQSF